MDVPRTMQIQEISAHPGTVPGHGTQRAVEVCKYIDVTTCIGCKACEVACVEWNDHPFRETTFNDTYQTMPSTDRVGQGLNRRVSRRVRQDVCILEQKNRWSRLRVAARIS